MYFLSASAFLYGTVLGWLSFLILRHEKRPSILLGSGLVGVAVPLLIANHFGVYCGLFSAVGMLLGVSIPAATIKRIRRQLDAHC